jgi:DNA-binding CsgD family transcriptional regulator
MTRSLRAPPMVGRDEQLAHALSLFPTVENRAGGALLVSGEPGIGKTRFVDELRTRFAETGGRVAASGCLEFIGGPLAAIEDIFYQLEIAEALGSPETTPHAALVRSLLGAATAQPTMIVLEDLHWADLATIDFVRFLVERIGDSTLLVVCTYRARSYADGTALTIALSRLARTRFVERLELNALSKRATRRLLAAVGGSGPALDLNLLDAICELSEGNPLYAEELLDQAVRAGRGKALTIPFSLGEIILERFRAFTGEERAVLAQAAVLGKGFDVAMLAAISERPVEQVREVVRAARDAGLLVENAPRGTLAFRHALIRESLYESLLSSEARQLHRRSAEHLEANNVGHADLAELAYHWWATGEASKAAELNERAGDRAMRTFAPNDAARFYGRALDFAPLQSETRLRILHSLGSAYALGGFPERARIAFEEAFALAGEQHGSMRAELALRIADQCSNQPAIGRAATWFEVGLAAAQAHSDRDTAYRALCGLVTDAAQHCDFRAFDAFVAKAERSGGERRSTLHVRYLTARGTMEVMRGELQSARHWYDEAIRFGDASGELLAMIIARGNAAEGLVRFGLTDEATSLAAAAAEALRPTELIAPLAFMLAVQARVAAAGGDLVAARRLVFEATDMLGVGVEMPRLTLNLAIPAILVGVRGLVPELVREFARNEILEMAFASEDTALIGNTSAAFVEFLAAEGREDEACALVARALNALPTIAAAPSLAVLAAMYGRREDAARASELLERWSAPLGNTIGRTYDDLVDGLTMRRYRSGPARAAGERAAQGFRSSGLRYLEAQALELAGDVAAARDVYRQTGALRDVERLAEGTRIPKRAVSALSEREKQITRLVAEGKHNREIASELDISARTVETHLTSIYGKLGISSRVELALFAEDKIALH